jgi:hypothetical protein
MRREGRRGNKAGVVDAVECGDAGNLYIMGFVDMGRLHGLALVLRHRFPLLLIYVVISRPFELICVSILSISQCMSAITWR